MQSVIPPRFPFEHWCGAADLTYHDGQSAATVILSFCRATTASQVLRPTPACSEQQHACVVIGKYDSSQKQIHLNQVMLMIVADSRDLRSSDNQHLCREIAIMGPPRPPMPHVAPIYRVTATALGAGMWFWVSISYIETSCNDGVQLTLNSRS